MAETRCELPTRGTDWNTLRERLVALGERDVDWRSAPRRRLRLPRRRRRAARRDATPTRSTSPRTRSAPLAFPSLKRMEEEVVGIGLGLLHAPDGALRQHDLGRHREHLPRGEDLPRRGARARQSTRTARRSCRRSAHPAFDKAAHYLGLRVVRVPVAADLRADVGAMAAAITSRTLMLVGSAPCFPYGLIDPIEELAELALERDVWLHVDACVGGYFAPFARMNGVPRAALRLRAAGRALDLGRPPQVRLRGQGRVDALPPRRRAARPPDLHASTTGRPAA